MSAAWGVRGTFLLGARASASREGVPDEIRSAIERPRSAKALGAAAKAIRERMSRAATDEYRAALEAYLRLAEHGVPRHASFTQLLLEEEDDGLADESEKTDESTTIVSVKTRVGARALRQMREKLDDARHRLLWKHGQRRDDPAGDVVRRGDLRLAGLGEENVGIVVRNGIVVSHGAHERGDALAGVHKGHAAASVDIHSLDDVVGAAGRDVLLEFVADAIDEKYVALRARALLLGCLPQASCSGTKKERAARPMTGSSNKI